MSFRAKALVVFFLFGAGAALIWLRHPSPNVLAPATSPQRGQNSEDRNKLVPQAAGTAAASKDDFGFVANSAKKALDGDGKAALQIADVLVKCLPIKIQYRDKPDPQAALESELADQKSPQWVIDRMRTRFLACRGFIHGNSFAGLPDRPGGYESIRFWNELAYQDRKSVV